MVNTMANKDLLSRVAALECKLSTPQAIHIIFKSFTGETDESAFDHYQAERAAEGFTPVEGWKQLKNGFLSGKKDDKNKFVVFGIIDSIAPENK